MTPLSIAGIFPLPPDIWNHFQKDLTISLYLDYMIKNNMLTCILHSFLSLMWRIYPQLFSQGGYNQYSNQSVKKYYLLCVYHFVQRRRERRDLIECIYSMLTNGGVKERRASDEEKRLGLMCLNIIFSSVYGMIENPGQPPPGFASGPYQIDTSDAKSNRMRGMWLDGSDDKEGKREWERRWREVGDIMTEEDAVETSIMHLCIPDHKRNDVFILPSECSSTAMEIVFNEKSAPGNEHHFPVYDIDAHPSSLFPLVIRNLPSGFNLRTPAGQKLQNLIESISAVVLIEQPVCSPANNNGLNTNPFAAPNPFAPNPFAPNQNQFSAPRTGNPFVPIPFPSNQFIQGLHYPVVRVAFASSNDALKVAKRLDGLEFHGSYLSVTCRMHESKPAQPKREEAERAESAVVQEWVEKLGLPTLENIRREEEGGGREGEGGRREEEEKG